MSDIHYVMGSGVRLLNFRELWPLLLLHVQITETEAASMRRYYVVPSYCHVRITCGFEVLDSTISCTTVSEVYCLQ
jgi:hypothetical protein